MPTVIPSVDFGELIRTLAEGIADAQRGLDRSSAEMVKELAETWVSIVPEVREVIHPDGRVTYEQARPREVSLLDLGITPTFYRFERSTVELSLDITVVEEDRPRFAERRYALRADTLGVQQERKLNHNLQAHSKLTTTLVPVPAPPRVDPNRSTTILEE